MESKDGKFKEAYDPVTGGYETYSSEYGYESNGKKIR